jgi:hypothetical protein
LLQSHQINLGIGYLHQFKGSKFAILPSFNLDGRFNSGDIGGLYGAKLLDEQIYYITMRSYGGFQLVPNIKTKLLFNLKGTLKIFGTIGYMYSFIKSVDISYDVIDPSGIIYSDTGYFTGTNWNYGIGLSFNPRILTK